MTQILNQALPIIFLITLGLFIRHKGLLSESAIDALRMIVVNITLPSVLFISFLTLELQSSYLFIIIAILILLIALFLLGKFFERQLKIRFSYFPYLMTGFEYGMLAISLFGTAYGLDKISYIAVVDLGHEIFIWFIFLPLLLIKRDGAQNPKEIIKAFLSAPVVLAIAASLLLNILGLGDLMHSLPIIGGATATLELLGQLTGPLILLIVGYGVQFNKDGLKEAVLTVFIRLVVIIPLALLINKYLISGYLHMDRYFEIALFVLLIMPPPFIVPLYASPNLENVETHPYQQRTDHSYGSFCRSLSGLLCTQPNRLSTKTYRGRLSRRCSSPYRHCALRVNQSGFNL